MYSKKIALNPQHWSIRNKIVGIVALIVLVTTVALAVNNHFSKTDLYQKQTAANLEEYGIQLADRSLGILQRNVENLITLALSPSLIEAVKEANGRYSGLDSDQIDEDIASRDKAWNENDPSSEELVKSILEDQTSLHLRSFRQTFPDEVEVFFTDERGLILGMTERTSDYLQADEEWWKQTYRDGQGSLYVSAVEYDESAKTWAVNVGVPIRSEGDQKIIGVLRGTVDITAMFSGLDDLEEEQGIHTFIVDKDKKVIYSKNPDDLMQEVPDQYSAFIDQGQAGWNINLKDTDGQPIRLAHLRMSGKYADNLDWSLLLYEHQDDVDLMMSQTDRRAMLVSGSILIAMIIAGIMLGTNLTRPFNLMTETARRLATGDVTLSGIDRKKVASNLTRRDEVGEMTRALSELIDYMRVLANSAQHIAVGDISVTIQSKGEQDLLGNAFQRMVVYLEEIARVADQLSVGVVNIEIVPQSENDVLRNAFVRMVDYQLEMLSAAKLMAMGDLSLILEPHSEDDAQGNAYVQMIDILRDIVGQVKRGAEHLGISSVELSQVASQASLASAQIAMTVGQVASGINQENDSVNKTVVSVDQMSRAIDSVAKGALEQAQSIENVANAINELTFAIKDIHHGAMEQAEQMERANSARGSMSQAIENVVKATEAVGVESDRSAKAARDGAELASTGIVGMERVREATEELANRVFDLGQRSSQIGAIVETIADIASTTNLLALNAAIEAARAGEHGKGFAVVADEVRKLAERSAIATQEISEMIRVIQSGVSNAVETMQKAGKDVRSAVELTNQESRAFETIAAGTQVSAEGIETIHTALQAMQMAEEQLLKAIRDASAVAERNRQASEAMDEMNNQVVAGLESVSAIVEENTAATQVMTSISEEVSQAIEDIAATSEENSASIEEVAAAAEQLNAQIEEVTASAGELSDMARGLQDAVSQFNLGEEEQMLPPESTV